MGLRYESETDKKKDVGRRQKWEAIRNWPMGKTAM
jgi:hypothetical protein